MWSPFILRQVPRCLQIKPVKTTSLSLCDVMHSWEMGWKKLGSQPWEPPLGRKKEKMLPFVKGLLPAWSPC